MRMRPGATWLPVMKIVLVAVVYAGAGRLGQFFAVPPGNVTAVWAPSGIALAALLLWGYRVWPGIFLGALAAETWAIFDHSSLLAIVKSIGVGTGISVGDTLQALLGAWVLQWTTGTRNPFNRIMDVVKFALLAGVCSCLVSASIGVTSLILGGFLPSTGFYSTWQTWWLGDVAGVFVFTPIFITWTTPSRIRWSTGRLIELGILVLLVVLVTGITFDEWFFHLPNFPLGFVILPFIVWVAFGFGSFATAVVTLVIAGLTLWGTVHGHGPFVRESLNASLLFMQIYLGIFTVTGLVLAAAVTEREQAEKALHAQVALLQTFIEHVPAAVAMLDRNLRYIAVSHRWLTDYRLKLTDITGLSHYEVFPEIGERWKAIHQRCLAGATERCEEDPFPRLDGTIDWVRWEVGPWYQADGSIGGIIMFTEVITPRKLTEQALQESEARYRTFFSVEPDALLLVDIETLQILDANEAAVDLYGYTHEELLTRTIVDLSAEPALTRASIQSTERKQVEHVPLRYHLRKDGTRFPIELSARAFTLGDRNVIFAAIRDITIRQKAELALQESEEKYRTLFAVEPDTLLLFDLHTLHILDANNAAMRSYGYTREEFLTLSIDDIATEPEEIRVRIQALKVGDVEVIPFRSHVRKDGSIFPVDISVSVVYVRDRKVAVAATRDISRLLEADRAKNQFLMVVSHELRTPLTSIIGWTQIALDSPELTAEALPVIMQSAREEVDLLERMIILSRIFTGKLVARREPIDLCELVAEVKNAWQHAAAAKHVELQWRYPAEPLLVPGDIALLRMAITEIVDNAIKFSQSDGTVALACRRESTGTISVSVTDNGRGIAAEDLPNLMKPFSQFHREEALGGIGIGLTLINGIVQAHAGKVLITSPGLGQGATVTIELPTAE